MTNTLVNILETIMNDKHHVNLMDGIVYSLYNDSTKIVQPLVTKNTASASSV